MESRLWAWQLAMRRANDAKVCRVYKEILNLHRATQRQRQLSDSDSSQRLALPSKRRQQAARTQAQGTQDTVPRDLNHWVKQTRNESLGIERSTRKPICKAVEREQESGLKLRDNQQYNNKPDKQAPR